MDQPATTAEPQFDPKTLHYDLRAEQPFCCFSNTGSTAIPVTLSVGKGAPLDLYDGGEAPLKIGARIYANSGLPEEPVRGAQIGEYRADSGAFTAQKGSALYPQHEHHPAQRCAL